MAPGIILTDKSVPAWAGYDGMGTFVIPAGKTLKIETTPHGEEILSETVPAGKTWTVSISVSVIES